MIVAAARWIAVAQVLLAPITAPAPAWLLAVLFGYALITTALAAMPRLSKRAQQDRKDELPEMTLALIILLDVAATAAVGWFSGVSTLALIVGLDAATLSDIAAVIFIGLAAVCTTVAIAFGHPTDAAGHPTDPLLLIGYAVALPLIPFLAAAHGLLGRHRAEQQTRSIMRVLDAGSDLGTKVTLNEALTQLIIMLREFRESVPWSNVVIYIARQDEEAQDEVLVEEAIEGAYADFYRGSKLRFGEGVVGFAATEQRPLIVSDIQKDYREASLPRPKAAHACLVVPIVTDRVTIGCVMLVAPKPGVFTFEQQRLVDRLVRLASVGIQNARLHSKTLELAETDSMTGLLTNRAYQERLEGEFRRAQLSKQSLALLIADVDFFKHVNDTYGHPQGDELLRQLGEVIRMHARKIDICCRYGGDEFVVLMPETIKAEAAMVAGRLRQAIEQTEFQLETTTAKITVSIGVAGYPQDVSTKQQLVQAADSALYAAKQAGRNNVKLATRETLPIRM